MVNNTEAAQWTLKQVTLLSEHINALLLSGKASLDSMKEMQSVLRILKSINLLFGLLEQEEPAMCARTICANAVEALEALQEAQNDRDIETGLRHRVAPLLQELMVDIRFFGLCYPDPDRMHAYYTDDMPSLCPLPGDDGVPFKYELSIVIPAYNKLDYTRACVEHLMQNLPRGIDYELILVNNGSNDGTREYFESLKPHKMIDLPHNLKSFGAVSRIIEGEYTLFISNDILITPMAIENMLTCIKSADDIGCVVPSCPNITNYQSPLQKCDYLANLDHFAHANNVSDPRRWEQRSRLVAPVVLTRSRSEGIHAFLGYRYPFSPIRFLAFSDDLMSLLYRRSGQKLILAKDAYVHHHGSITVGDGSSTGLYAQGVREFEATFGVNPWARGAWPEPELAEGLNFDHTDRTRILGVNCDLGSHPLKIREILRERGNADALIYNATTHAAYAPDLVGLSDEFKLCGDLMELCDAFDEESFDYIVVESGLGGELGMMDVLKRLASRLCTNGTMALFDLPTPLRVILSDAYGCRQIGRWTFLNQAAMEGTLI